jgi:hypothetical protein
MIWKRIFFGLKLQRFCMGAGYCITGAMLHEQNLSTKILAHVTSRVQILA